MPRREHRVAEREGDLRQREREKADAQCIGAGEFEPERRRGESQQRSRVPAPRRPCHAHREHDQRGRDARLVANPEDEDERERRDDVSARAVLRHELLEREPAELQSESELYAAHHHGRDDALHPREAAGERQHEHQHADREAARREHLARDAAGDHDRRDGLERLHRHRHAIHRARGDLQEAVDEKDGRGVEVGGDDHAHEQGHVRAEVAHGARPFLPREAQGGPGNGGGRHAYRHARVHPRTARDGDWQRGGCDMGDILPPPHHFGVGMASAAIEIRGASKRYAEHVAVRDLSLTVPVGTVYGLLGPNGAGKTTTIRMILNVIAPDTGTIAVLGQPNTSAVLDRVGYLPEERGLYKKMKVKDVLIFLAELKGVPRREGLRRADEWLERLALKTPEKDWGLSKVDELSRGMQQKAMFASTLMHDPDLVILDEPFSGLDPINAQVMKDTVVELKRRGKTVIFSTHLMDNAERLCDSVCIIAHGEKVLDGTVAGVKAEHAGRFVAVSVDDATPAVKAVFGDRSLVRNVDDQNTFFELEMSPGADAQQLLRRLVEAGARVHRFELVQPSLHRIFLEKVGATGVEPGMSGHG